MSIISYLSTHGTTKKTPGPLAPPAKSLPSLKITALSNSWTTFTTKIRERGRVMRMMMIAMTVNNRVHAIGAFLSQP